MRLPPQEYDRLRSTLTAVGEDKPIGYLPLDTIRNWLEEEPNKLAEELRKLGLATVLLNHDHCCIKSGALYAYDRDALTNLLEDARIVLHRHAVSADADQFVRQIAAKWYEIDHPVSAVIQQAFAEIDNNGQ